MLLVLCYHVAYSCPVERCSLVMKSPLLLLLLVVALAACSTANNAPDATPTVPRLAENLPTLTAIPPQPTAVLPTETPPPTFTPVPPTVAPTETPPPLPTATPDYLNNPPVRNPTGGRITNGKTYPPGAYEFIHDQFSVPAPAGNVPDDFIAALPGVPEGVCPLTGEQGDPAIGTRRPVNVRIDNSAPGRPQAGLENADVVWETLAEGGVTRLTVTYHCRPIVNAIGPIRSARLIDLQLTPMLQAWLVHVGASQQVTDMIWASAYADRDIDEWKGDPAFYRINNPPLGWLSTYSTPQLISGVITARGNSGLAHPLRGWQFSDEIPAGATGTATSITIPYFPNSGSVVSYRYNADTGRYLRYQGNSPHTQQSGQQLAPDNVVVLYAPMTETPIVEDSLGALSLHFAIVGEGRAALFRDGQVWEATWVREGENVLIRVVDSTGTVIPFAPGQTFVQIVQDTLPVSWQ